MLSIQRNSHRGALLSALLVLLTAFTLAACDDKDKGAEGAPAGQEAGAEGGAEGGGQQQAAPVTVARPLVTNVDEFREFSGRFEATDTVDIRSRVSGYLMQVLFKEGAIVKKGDPLFVIDPRQIEANLRQRQADLKLAQSQTTAAVNDFDRAQTLFSSGDVSEALLDQRRAAKDSALATVDAAKAAVAAAQVDMVYTKIAAPISGRIGRAQVTIGNLVTPGQEVLTTLVSMDPIHFYFDVDEKAYVDYVRQTRGAADHAAPGIPVSVALTDETDYSRKGVLDFIDNAISNSTGTMRARAVLENPDMVLTPGMFGRVRIRTGGAENGILIPDEAIMIDQSRKYVYVVDDKGMVATRSIEAGLMDKGLRIITKGLDGTEWVIVNGLQRAREGAPVTPQQTTLQPKADENAGSATPLPAPDAGIVEEMPGPEGTATPDGVQQDAAPQNAAPQGAAPAEGTNDTAPANAASQGEAAPAAQQGAAQ